MPNKEIFVLKIIWKKSIASLHRLTQAVQRANLRRMAGDPTWVLTVNFSILLHFLSPSRRKAWHSALLDSSHNKYFIGFFVKLLL